MRKLITTATLTALALSGVAAATAAGPASTTIRSADLNISDTGSAGHVDFLRHGLHVYTTDATGDAKAAGYFAITPQPIPAVASLTWVGSQAQPGGQIVFDTNSNRADADSYNVLVFEPAYNGDVWMTGGSARAALRGITCPATTGGSGTDCHGTLAEWAVANPAAQAYAGGFALGSGVKGDGVIERMQYGTSIFEFTNVAEATDGTDGIDGTDGADGATGPVGATGPQGPSAAPATTGTPGSGGSGASGALTVNGTVTGKVKPRKLKLVFATAKQPSGSTQAKSLVWKIKVDGSLAGRIVQRAGERDVWIRPFGSGKHVVQVTSSAGTMQNFKLTVK